MIVSAISFVMIIRNMVLYNELYEKVWSIFSKQPELPKPLNQKVSDKVSDSQDSSSRSYTRKGTILEEKLEKIAGKNAMY